MGDRRSAPGLLRGHAAHRHHGRSPRVVLGNEANRDFLLLGSLLGNCQLSLARWKHSRFGGFSTCGETPLPRIAGHGDAAGPIWVVPIFVALTVIVPICPSGLRVPEYFAI